MTIEPVFQGIPDHFGERPILLHGHVLQIALEGFGEMHPDGFEALFSHGIGSKKPRERTRGKGGEILKPADYCRRLPGRFEMTRPLRRLFFFQSLNQLGQASDGWILNLPAGKLLNPVISQAIAREFLIATSRLDFFPDFLGEFYDVHGR